MRSSTSSARAEPLSVEWLGRVDYAAALALQDEAVARRRAGLGGDRLLLLEHPPVVTLGRRADPAHLRSPAGRLRERGVEVHEVARGGDVTWHGPGQLVGYLVLDLAARGRPDVGRFLRELEAALVEALGGLGVAGEPREGFTGVFVCGSVPPRKIASIGIGVRGWVTFHGFALNATCDLAGFDDIVPCGLPNVAMTSVARELGRAPDPALFAAVRDAVRAAFLRRFA
jgi:lipoate-protein ligase B